MNTNFKAKFLQTLANKKANKGFTLIELLVVVIIIGVLAAIALPNLLGQVGKARESEAKSTLGAMTRAQQGYFTEKAEFAVGAERLEVPVGNEKYYVITVPIAGVQMANGSTNPSSGVADQNIANGKNGTRDYVSGIAYNPTDRTFDSALCRAGNGLKSSKYALNAGNRPANSGSLALTSSQDVACDTASNTTETVK